ncbi:hypothetical protein CDD83_5727 [Cordyceps sp. RAO-2017]|nr:hypothetical protein CDD83_5727 [Cordyceps sp. RAO-2017]
MDDGSDDTDDFGSMLPDFDQKRFGQVRPVVADGAAVVADEAVVVEDDKEPSVMTVSSVAPAVGDTPPVEVPSPRLPPKGAIFAAPIKIHTNVGVDHAAAAAAIEEVRMSQLGGGLGGLWGVPPPPDEAERFRDLSHTKRRWTVNERA